MSFAHLICAKKKIARGLLILLLAPYLFFGIPQKAHAQWVVFDPANVVQTTLGAIWGGITSVATTIGTAFTGSLVVKEYVGDGVANFVAKLIIKRLTAQTVNWINSGFKGNPAFVTDPKQFFLDVGDREVARFLSTSGTFSQLCSPFKAQVRLALVKNYLSDENNYSCTIDRVLANANSTYNQFINDFDQGGWDAWFSMTQNAQNNPIGSYIEAKHEMDLRVSLGKYKYEKQLDWGKGFLSFEKCPAGKSVDEALANGSFSGEDEQEGLHSGDCMVEKDTVTPGSVIQGQLDKVLGGPLAQLEVADEINEIVSALMTQLISRVVGGIGNGLRGASATNATEPRSLTEQIRANSIENTPAASPETLDAFQGRINSTLPPELQSGGTGGGSPIASAQPVISLRPDLTTGATSPITINQGDNFSDPGTVAADVNDGDVSALVVATSNVDVNIPGTYTITYSFTNSLGVAADPVTRTVIVRPVSVDTTTGTTP